MLEIADNECKCRPCTNVDCSSTTLGRSGRSSLGPGFYSNTFSPGNLLLHVRLQALAVPPQEKEGEERAETTLPNDWSVMASDLK